MSRFWFYYNTGVPTLKFVIHLTLVFFSSPTSMLSPHYLIQTQDSDTERARFRCVCGHLHFHYFIISSHFASESQFTNCHTIYIKKERDTHKILQYTLLVKTLDTIVGAWSYCYFICVHVLFFWGDTSVLLHSFISCLLLSLIRVCMYMCIYKCIHSFPYFLYF